MKDTKEEEALSMVDIHAWHISVLPFVVFYHLTIIGIRPYTKYISYLTIKRHISRHYLFIFVYILYSMSPIIV